MNGIRDIHNNKIEVKYDVQESQWCRINLLYSVLIAKTFEKFRLIFKPVKLIKHNWNFNSYVFSNLE